jgi:hypothetical protein
MTLIQLQKVSLKPKKFKTLRRKFQSKVSNALVISILRAKLPPKDLLCKRLAASEAMHKQSLMFLSWMNPFCSSEISEGIKEASLAAIIFEIILNLKLAIAIGLN